MSMTPLGWLFLACLAMFMGSIVAALIPLMAPIGAKTTHFLSILGAGLLVGTALTVVLPEGSFILVSIIVIVGVIHCLCHELQPLDCGLKDKRLGKRSRRNLKDEMTIHNAIFRGSKMLT